MVLKNSFEVQNEWHLCTEKGGEFQTWWQAIRGLKSHRTVGVEGMQILCEERRLYGYESKVNWGVFEDYYEADERQKKHKKECRWTVGLGAVLVKKVGVYNQPPCFVTHERKRPQCRRKSRHSCNGAIRKLWLDKAEKKKLQNKTREGASEFSNDTLTPSDLDPNLDEIRSLI